MATGSEKFNARVNISATVPGTGDGSSGGVLSFNTQSQNVRSGLALVNGVVYICWAFHEDAYPYHGWMLGYNATNMQQQAGIFNTTPNGGLGGIWMAGGAPAVDASGNLYVSTGNGTFDANMGTSPNNDLGDNLLKIGSAGGLNMLDYFTPDDQATLTQFDVDLGSGGVLLLPDQTTGPVAHLLISGGKEGVLYLVDRDNMGHFQPVSNNQIVQNSPAGQGSFSTPAFWLNSLYIAAAVQGNRDNLRMYSFTPATGFFNTTQSSSSSHSFPFPDATPVVSSSGSSNGIVWGSGHQLLWSAEPLRHYAGPGDIICLRCEQPCKCNCGTARRLQTSVTRQAVPSNSWFPRWRMVRCTSAPALKWMFMVCSPEGAWRCVGLQQQRSPRIP